MSGLTHFCYATLLLYHFQPKKSKDNFDKNRLVLRSLPHKKTQANKSWYDDRLDTGGKAATVAGVRRTRPARLQLPSPPAWQSRPPPCADHPRGWT